HSAGLGDQPRFSSFWNVLRDGWPDDWRLIKDHPWLLTVAGRYAEESDWDRQAREVWELTRDLWERLGDEEAVERIDERLSESADGPNVCRIRGPPMPDPTDSSTIAFRVPCGW
ncbi:MAG: hypothetical protein ABEN55_20225, partial [Bradymonadaceae bacterium]